MRTISAQSPTGGSTKSIAPAAMALRGIPSNFAVSSCANVIPPSAFTAFEPSVPSDAVPERMTLMARLPRSAASERSSASIGITARSPRGSTRSTPSANVTAPSGGAT